MKFLTLIKFVLFSTIAFLYPEKSIVVVVASYNNVKYVESNLESIFKQDYENYKVIYINDCSKDKTLSRAKKVASKYKKRSKVTFINNRVRLGALYNHYNTIINYTNPEDIVVLVDGDDALIGEDVFRLLDETYSDPNVWMTYGQFIHSSDRHVGFCHPFPEEVIQNNMFRSYEDMPSHLKTFYSWLFRKIKTEDLMFEGKFYSMTGDLAMILPMIEMAGKHHKFISKPIYYYNDQNPINDHEVDGKLQTKIAKLIRSKPKYLPIDNRK